MIEKVTRECLAAGNAAVELARSLPKENALVLRMKPASLNQGMDWFHDLEMQRDKRTSMDIRRKRAFENSARKFVTMSPEELVSLAKTSLK